MKVQKSFARNFRTKKQQIKCLPNWYEGECLLFCLALLCFKSISRTFYFAPKIFNLKWKYKKASRETFVQKSANKILAKLTQEVSTLSLGIAIFQEWVAFPESKKTCHFIRIHNIKGWQTRDAIETYTIKLIYCISSYQFDLYVGQNFLVWNRVLLIF